MNTFLKVIGFSKLESRTELDKIIGEIMTSPTRKKEYIIKGNQRFVELSKEYMNGMGITIRGHYDNKGFFHLNHFFPYLEPENISTHEKIYFNKNHDDNSYEVLCDEIQLGVALTFYLQNVVDYMNSEDRAKYSIYDTNVLLSGMCKDGKILLPVNKNEKSITRNRLNDRRRKRLLYEAKNGNQTAIDSLAINEIDTYAMVERRKKHEDVYSIVDSSFYFCGNGLDCYSIIGTILKITKEFNNLSRENVYKFVVDCNNIKFSICINENDLLGIPSVGARFKGRVWLQGRVDF